MPRPAKRRRRKSDDENFQANPDDEEDEEEPLADDDEDEEERKKRQKKADLEGGLKLWHDVLADKRSSPKGPLADLKGPYTLKWSPDDRSLPKELVKAFHEWGHPIESCSTSRDYVRALAKICFEKDVAFPFPGNGHTLREWIAMLLAWAATLKRGSRRNLQLREAALLTEALLVVSAEGAYKLATPKPGACKLCSAIAIKLLKIFPLADEITYRDYIKVTRIKKRRADDDFKLTVLKKKTLYRDHLELSILFRGWLCVHCNSRTLHKLDSLSSDDYVVFGRRVYVNCTTAFI